MNKSRLRALLIDDDARLGALLVEYLAKNEIDLTVAPDGERGLKLLGPGAGFSFVLLDLMLPGMDGLSVCRKLREKDAHLPVLMLTAKGDDVDKIVGLELGADDYLAKPFNPRELLARVRAVLRRTQQTQERPRFLTGVLSVDYAAREVHLASKRVHLTSFEFEVLACLCRAAGRVLSREQLLDALKGEEFESFDRSIDVHISKLRSKIEEDPKNPRYIKTVRGVGYVLTLDDHIDSDQGGG